MRVFQKMGLAGELELSRALSGLESSLKLSESVPACTGLCVCVGGGGGRGGGREAKVISSPARSSTSAG